MYGFPHRRRLLIAAFAAVIVLASGLAVLGVPSASAADDPKYVRGYVRDTVGREVENVDVVVNIRAQATNLTRSTLTDQTDSNGFYSCFFTADKWDIGDLIEVIADYNGDQRANYTTAIDQNAPFIQYVNITYPYEIPEFMNTTGFLIAGGAIGLLAAVFLVVKKRT